jgi:hypothetical protein
MERNGTPEGGSGRKENLIGLSDTNEDSVRPIRTVQKLLIVQLYGRSIRQFILKPHVFVTIAVDFSLFETS